LASYADELRCVDLFAETGPMHALRQSSIETRLYQLHYAGSVLVLDLGHPVEQVTDIAYLVHYHRDVARALWQRAGKKPGRHIYETMYAVKLVAKHRLGWTNKQLEPISRVCRRFAPKVGGQTRKNRERLQQMRDKRNLGALLQLPIDEMDSAISSHADIRKVAFRFSLGLAIELALFTVLRVSNLAGLHIGEHLRWSRPRREGLITIIIPSELVKNDEDLEIEIPDHIDHYLRVYFERFRPLLMHDSRNDHLFPGTGCRPKRADTLAKQVTRLVRRRTGLIVNMHLFRHLAGQLLLEDDPTAYGPLSRALGHKSQEQAYRTYSGEETRHAFKRLDELIRARRSTLVPITFGRKGR
jgi:hypothetical protein